jgi:hypothetical protein
MLNIAGVYPHDLSIARQQFLKTNLDIKISD